MGGTQVLQTLNRSSPCSHYFAARVSAAELLPAPTYSMPWQMPTVSSQWAYDTGVPANSSLSL